MTDNSSNELAPLTADELAAETGTALPAKEVMSLLDLNANLDLALSAAAPIDLAVAANANIAAPIEGAVGANVLSLGSTAEAGGTQATEINQGITGDSTATSLQHSAIDQGTTTPTSTSTTPTTTGTPDTTSTSAGTTDGNLLNVNVNLNGNLNLAAPIDGAVAAQANAAAPIDAAVSANVGSIDSTAVGVANQEAIINQNIDGNATATGDQVSNITQP